MSKIRPDTRIAILEAGFQVFSTDPSASLGDVADHAGVGRATLHRYFASREILMIALAKQAMAELNEAVDAATANAESHTHGLRLALDAIIPLANRQAFLANQPVDDDPEIAAAYQADLAELRDEIDAARGEGLFSPDVPTEWIAQTYDALIYAAWQMVRDGHATPRQASGLAWRTLTLGLNGDGNDR